MISYIPNNHVIFSIIEMEVGNKEDQVTVITPKEVPVIPVQETSATKDHIIAIPIEELGDDINEAAKDNEKPAETKKDMDDDCCRFCHQDGLEERLEEPCGCIGSVKFAHRKCVAQWCNTKRDTTCEICKQPYQPNYAVTTPPPYDDVEIYMSERWRIPFTETRVLTPLQLAERGINRLLRSMNVDFSLRNPTVGMIFGTALLLFLAAMVIRDASHYAPSKEDKIVHVLFCALMVIITPIYILSWIVECRDQRERERERLRVVAMMRERETAETELPA
ncbi:uncharacterized protein LOC130715468 [Lotus japonicus]|uniref:uncharacterized protein LOC130715468 n=1 Tax=Lotus japonicus TaxID=34305 RepID=UPI002589BE87|nr:uncharacterized protein LOC130715468 [Lotus japonicus]